MKPHARKLSRRNRENANARAEKRSNGPPKLSRYAAKQGRAALASHRPPLCICEGTHDIIGGRCDNCGGFVSNDAGE